MERKIEIAFVFCFSHDVGLGENDFWRVSEKFEREEKMREFL